MGEIKVEKIGKAYKNYENRWSRFLEWVEPFKKKRHKLNWVLQDVNFTVVPGEAFGIIGINGAGKSTLLKLITGTTQPTSGKVTISGRVSALLELGMGFHPDFTGRQNVAMAAQLLGLNSGEICDLMPKVEAFAEIGEYIDQPVRVYSSGMQVRLAFSVATVRRPDVLIVDEALSVGDTYFQHKSFNRIREFREQGTTLLIVSHDKGVIQSLCDRAILLDQGRIIKEGKPVDVTDFYNAMLSDKGKESVEQEELTDGNIQTKSGTGEAKIEDVGLYDINGQKIEYVQVGETITLRVQAKVCDDIETLVMGYGIKGRLGQDIYGTNTWYTEQVINNPLAGNEYQFEITFSANMGVGSYSVSVSLHDQKDHLSTNYCWQDLALVFEVVNLNEIQFIGCNWMEPKIIIKEL